MAVNISTKGGIYIEISGDYTKLQADLNRVDALAKAAGKDISDALSGALSPKNAASASASLTKYLATAARAAQGAKADLTGMDAEFRKIGQSIGIAEKDLAGFVSMQRQMFQNQSARTFTDSLRGMQRLTGASNEEMNRLAKSLGGVGYEFTNAGRSATALGSCIDGVIKKYGFMLISAQQLRNAAEAIGQSVLQADRLNKSYTTIYDSAVAAKQQLDYLYGLSNELGLRFQSTAEAAKTFFAAGKGTALEGELNHIFKSVSSAGAALSLTEAEMQGVFLALGQMISKGKVQAEELRGQLGERLPGAFRLAAQAMGMTTGELDKFLSSGKVTAEMLLPKLAGELDRAFGGKAVAAGKGLQGQLNRLSTELDRFNASLADSESLAGAIGGVAEAMKTLAENGPAIGSAIKDIIVTLGAAALAWKGYALVVGDAGKAGETAKRSMLQTAKDAVAVETAARNAAIQAAKANLDAAVQAQASVAWKTRQIDQIALHTIGTKHEERAVAMLTAHRLKLAAADKVVAAAEADLAMAQAAATRMAVTGATVMSGLKAAGASVLALFGGPWGLAFTAAAGLVAYLATQESQAQRISKEYAEEIRKLGEAYEDAAGKAQGLATSEKEILINQQQKILDGALADFAEMKDEFARLALPGHIGFWTVDTTEITKLFKTAGEGKITFEEVWQGLAKIQNAMRDAGEGSKEFHAKLSELIEKAHGAAAIEERVDNATESIRRLKDAATEGGQALRGMFNLDTQKVTTAIAALEQKVEQARRSDIGQTVATALIDIGVSSKDIDRFGNVSKEVFSKYDEATQASILKTQALAKELYGMSNKAKSAGASASRTAFQASLASERTSYQAAEAARSAADSLKNLELRYSELVAQIDGNSLGAALDRSESDYKTQLDAIAKAEAEIANNRALWAKEGKLTGETRISLDKQQGALNQEREILQLIKDANDELARRAYLERTASAAADYSGLIGDLRGVYKAEVDLLEVKKLSAANTNDYERLAIIERIRQATARRDLDIGGMFETGMANMAKDAQQRIVDFWENTLPNSIGSATDTIGTAFAQIGLGTKSVSQSFAEMGKSIQNIFQQIISDFINMSIRMAMFGQNGSGGLLGGLISGIGGLFTGGVPQPGSPNFVGPMPQYAAGGVVSAPSLSAFSNAIVSKPTIFPFARGVGLMGEAGAEAIMPLRRGTGGRLGVDASGFGGQQQVPQVNVIVNTPPGVGVAEQEKKPNGHGGFDMTLFLEMVDNAMASGIASGRSKTARAMNMRGM
ncbi:MAG: tape measure protein [Desulfovibrio sp.]|nr:tape measure protein [Desulfovibrio sp.]